ncbi:hypothetical protein Pa4123_72620 [Phytohabitans aurantiacus]|uniref:Glycosyl hydrolase family 98 putative carbohydrate-binding module domain-containing protein n=1 Tax=Phytohabitans aurantiacus TaxID=3016789 RepID=A0ABQ5R7N1_9ACTN|nr:hypothetical protein Pa4123_72620 [Phytohabitans aurantiacus]
MGGGPDNERLSLESSRIEAARMRRAERIGIAIGVITLVTSSAIALAAWRWPQPVPEKPTPPPTTGAKPAPVKVEDATYLDALSPQSGAANLTKLPRELADESGYEHAIVVRCPTNQANDKVRSVNYLVRGRYLDFSATVRPYYEAEKDARTYVYALSGVKERDGTLTQRTRGTQFEATMTRPARLDAEVEGAEELTIQVRCEAPEGVIVLAGARLVNS